MNNDYRIFKSDNILLSGQRSITFNVDGTDYTLVCPDGIDWQKIKQVAMKLHGFAITELAKKH